MQKRPPKNPTLRERIERVRVKAGGQPTSPVRKRRVPRYRVEARRQRMLRWAIGAAAAVVALILVVGVVNDLWIKPRQVLASVGDVDIRRRDYWKGRAIDLWEQANQFQQFASFVGPDQQQQYLAQAAESLRQAEEVWGSTDVDPGTLGRMIDDQVFVQNLGDLDLEVTDQEAETYVLNQFAPPGAPLLTPTPTPTLIPARAAIATQTALAGRATNVAATVAALTAPGAAPTSAPIPPPPGSTPPAIAGAASPIASPTGASPVASPLASPSAGTPSPTATIAPTPNAEQARATAEAGFAEFSDGFLEPVHLSRQDYERLVARPTLARQKVEAAIAAEIGQSAEQVNAAHILVDTQDLARELYDQLTSDGADFAQVARERSTDQATAGNGGDLGWFAREEMVAPFAEVAFALPPGEIGEPFETEFGWHLVRVVEHAADRPLTDQQIIRIAQARVERWLEEQRAETSISSRLEPTPTPFAEPFQPPVEAPPAPTPTPIPAASPVASPLASPVASPVPAAPATPAAAP